MGVFRNAWRNLFGVTHAAPPSSLAATIMLNTRYCYDCRRWITRGNPCTHVDIWQRPESNGDSDG